jgi:hypothetical protein
MKTPTWRRRSFWSCRILPAARDNTRARHATATERIGSGGIWLRRCSPRKCPDRALATLDGVVEGVAVGNIDECSAAAELPKDRDPSPLSSRG